MSDQMRKFKLTGIMELTQSEIEESEDGDEYSALPECVRMNLEDIELEEIEE